MSRSNPNDNGSPNPATRWFEWNGEEGSVRYYDKETKKNVDVGDDFVFMLLDQLGSVGGWHDASGSNIYSNEVKDTRAEVLVVKSFKGGVLAEGIYQAIKDRVSAQGGQFVANCYIAFKNGGGKLAVGSLRLKGAALGTWMDFCKAHRAELYSQAIHIKGSKEGKKGRIVFRTPILSIKKLSEASNAEATSLDKTLQAFLDSYFKRTTRDRVVAAPVHISDEAIAADVAVDHDFDGDDGPMQPLTDDDIPF